MNLPRSLLPVIGLVCVFLFYYFKNDAFLLIAVGAFLAGFILTRRRRSTSKPTLQGGERSQNEKKRKVGEDADRRDNQGRPGDTKRNIGRSVK